MATLLGGCAFETASTTPTSGRPEASKPAPTAKQPTALQKPVVPAQVERLKKAMPSQVKVGIIDDPEINAASAGNGEFYVTTGLLEKANDEQPLAVMAHEVAHEDLGI